MYRMLHVPAAHLAYACLQAAQRGQKQGAVTAPEADDPLADHYGDTELVQSQVRPLGSAATGFMLLL